MFDAGKTRMIGLPYGEKKLWQYVKPFSSDTGAVRTDRQRDGQICYINIACQKRICFFLIKHVVAFYPHAQYVRVKIEAQNVG